MPRNGKPLLAVVQPFDAPDLSGQPSPHGALIQGLAPGAQQDAPGPIPEPPVQPPTAIPVRPDALLGRPDSPPRPLQHDLRTPEMGPRVKRDLTPAIRGTDVAFVMSPKRLSGVELQERIGLVEVGEVRARGRVDRFAVAAQNRSALLKRFHPFG